MGTHCRFSRELLNLYNRWKLYYYSIGTITSILYCSNDVLDILSTTDRKISIPFRYDGAIPMKYLDEISSLVIAIGQYVILCLKDSKEISSQVKK